MAFPAGCAFTGKLSHDRVKIKNTFIDDWADGDEGASVVPGRPFTCPNLSAAYEPEAELSPEQQPAQVMALPVGAMATQHAGLERILRMLGQPVPAMPVAASPVRGLAPAQHHVETAERVAATPAGDALTDTDTSGLEECDPVRQTAPVQPASADAPVWLAAEECRDVDGAKGAGLLDGDVPSPELLSAKDGSNSTPSSRQKRRERRRQLAQRADQVTEPTTGIDANLACASSNGSKSGGQPTACPSAVSARGTAWPSQQSAARRERGGRSGAKLWCHIYLSQEMLAPGFDLAKKIIGHNGKGTRGIFDATGAKIRLRGRGSGHLEGGREAPVHLMLTVTADHGEFESFSTALSLAAAHLSDTERRFHSFCRHWRLPVPRGSCFWVGEIRPEAQKCLDSLADVLPYGSAPPARKSTNDRRTQC